MSIPVWSYWQGQMPGWIELCLQSLRIAIPDIQILTPETWNQWRKDTHGERLDNLPPNVISDYIRVHQLYHHGGIWIDADAIAFRDVRPIAERLVNHDCIAYRVGNPAPQWCSALLCSRQGGRVMSEYLMRMDRVLASDHRIGKLRFGPRMLAKSAWSVGTKIGAIPTRRVHQVHWRNKHRLQGGDPVEIADDAYCCMLTHRALGRLAKLSTSRLLHGDWPISHIFRRAILAGQA